MCAQLVYAAADKHHLLLVAGVGSILIWGGKGSKDARLPITLGPQKPAVRLCVDAFDLA